jgi:hypothetical protein
MVQVTLVTVNVPRYYAAAVPTKEYVARLEHALATLVRAINSECSEDNCLRLWSKFIRLRDLDSCVVCDGKEGIQSHHICRKSFLEQSRFEPGNGIALCKDCHKEAHQGFNRKPDLDQPMDAQGGEKIETMVRFYGTLLDDARKRGILHDGFYHLSDSTLRSFKRAQGFDPGTEFPGYRLEQAYSIWRSPNPKVIQALVQANWGIGQSQADPA